MQPRVMQPDDRPLSLEEICEYTAAKMSKERSRWSWSAIACNPHISLRHCQHAVWGPFLIQHGAKIVKFSQHIMDFIAMRDRASRHATSRGRHTCDMLVCNKNPLSWLDDNLFDIQWLDPQYVIAHKWRFARWIWSRMQLVNLHVLRAVGLHVRDVIGGKFVGSRISSSSHATCDPLNNTNHHAYRFYSKDVNWAFICELNAAATPDDIRAVYENAPWYISAGVHGGVSNIWQRGNVPFICPACAAACPDVPLDQARKYELYKHARFWEHNMFIDRAFVRAHMVDGRGWWIKLSKNRAIWRNADAAGDDNTTSTPRTILTEYHARLDPVAVAQHAPMQLVYKYWPANKHPVVHAPENLAKNSTCPRWVILQNNLIEKFARVALPQDEFDDTPRADVI